MKRLLILIAAAAALVAGAWLAHSHLFREVEQVPVWVVASYSGDVEVSAAGGEWKPATIKARLAASDRIRTGPDSEAMLLHDASHVTVRPETEITVSSLSAKGNEFDLVGMAFVEARGDRIVLADPLTDAKVDSSDAGYGVTVRPDGYVSVSVKRGSADFTAMGTTREVGEGRESYAAAGRPPSAPTPIPESILLNVSFPDADTFNTRIARISGNAAPGSRVVIGGEAVQTDLEGRFTTDVSLDEGPNRIEVRARDALGRTRTETSRPIHVDTAAPSLDGVSIGRRKVTP